MKTNIIKTLAAGIIASMMITSCSVEKRHYTSGYSVQWNSKKGNVSATEASYVAKQTPKTETKKVTEEKTVALQAPAKQVAATTNNTVNKTLVASANKTIHPLNTKTKVNSFENTVASHNAKIVERVVTNKKSSSGGDTYLVIEIILCFFPFFNLIAMYLKDGKRVTVNFWIDLILDILFFLPGIVFALLVVLDVINLA